MHIKHLFSVIKAGPTASRSGRRMALNTACAVIAGLVPMAAAAQTGVQAGATWTTAAGTVQGTRFSGLTEITNANAGTMVEEFNYPTSNTATHQGNALVAQSKMYVVTPFPNKLMAFDITHPGTLLWTYDPGASTLSEGVACCDVVNRGAAYANGMVIYGVLDGNVVAVNADTGKQVWKTQIANPSIGETLTAAPIVVGNNVIIGNAGGELGVRGWVQALNVNTGAVVWKAYSTGPDSDVLIGPSFKPYYAKDQGKNLGLTSWQNTLWQQGGSTSWGWMTYDPELNLIFYGTGNPGVWNPDMRPGDNKWSSTIFARNPQTGQAVWAYQLTPHDNWDFDAVNEDTVVDIPINGVPRKVIIHFNKNGFAYTLDRATGQLINAQPFGPNVNWATGVSLTTGLEQIPASSYIHTGQTLTNNCPSALGLKDWEPSAYSPTTGLFYLPLLNLCSSYEPLLTEYIAGTPFQGIDLGISPGPGGYLGEMVAWNPVTNQRAWSVQEPLPLYAGTLATAGNVVFYGTLSGLFKAVDATNGHVLFQTQLECGVVSNPITFTGGDGHQRVAITTGVGWLAGGLGGGECPGETNLPNPAVPGGSSGLPTPPAPPAPPGLSHNSVGEAPASVHGPGYAAAVSAYAKANGVAAAATPAVTSGYVHVFKLP